MTNRIVSAPVRPEGRPLATIALSTMLAAFAFPALAQEAAKPPAPAAAKPAAPKPAAAATKPAAKPAAAPAQAQQPAPAQPSTQTASIPDQQQAPQLIFSPWTKFCLKGQEAGAKQVCFTGKDARIESGMPVLAAVIIEPEGEQKKILRVTLPLGMSLQHGTRVIIDQGQPATGAYVICFTNGCMADYEVNPDLIGKLKKGQQLVVQAINSANQPLSLAMPLGDFQKAYEGAPTDPKVFEEQQKKLQDELQRRADEARKRLESSAQPPKP
ncbi:MAG TPA: invasion associated locus B family protein [Xanthobacteraceae bacterium]|jgi:invasion protein IalB